MNYDIVLHVDADDPKTLMLAFANAANYKASLPGETFRMALVANGPSAKLFTSDHADLAERGENLLEQGLSIRLCNNALNAFVPDRSRLWPGLEVVPAGIVEIVRLQREGFAYIKP